MEENIYSHKRKNKTENNFFPLNKQNNRNNKDVFDSSFLSKKFKNIYPKILIIVYYIQK